MIEIIARARRISACEISVRLFFSKMVSVPGSNVNDIDHDLDEHLWVVLRYYPSVNFIKMMEDILNPLFQNKRRMVASGLFTDSQYDSGVIKLVDCMDCALENLDIRKHVIVLSYHNKVKNKWDGDEEVVF